MIGLQHGSKHDADILAGLLNLLYDPELREKLISAAQQHRAALEAHIQAKTEAEAAHKGALERLAAAAKVESDLKKKQSELNALAAKLSDENRKLADKIVEHAQATVSHEQAVAAHNANSYALDVRKTQLDARQSTLAEREAEIEKAEKAHIERTRKLRELLG